MEFTTQLSKDTRTDLYHWYFPVPSNVAQKLITPQHKRVVATVNGAVTYHCAIYGDGAGGYRILLNQKRCKQLGLVQGENIHVQLEKDTSEYGVPISDALREVLNQNPEADKLFHQLTKGTQRTLIYWSDNVKSEDIKIRRALVMTDHLVNQGGKPDFKALNLEMKKANQAAKQG